MKFVLEYLGAVVDTAVLEPGREYFIGRQEDCDFVLDKDAGISRKHAKIYQSEEGAWRVESLSEWGGLFLEGEEAPAFDLKSSCSLNLKNYSLKFSQEEEKQSESMDESVDKGRSEDSLLGEEDLTRVPDKEARKDSHLLYSLHVSIEGEFSDHVSLSLGDSWILGRSEDCDICVDYGFLTRKHIQFLKRESKFYVKDLGSANKTLLNGEDMTPNKEYLLKPNDEISVADLKILFEVRNTQYESLMKNLPASLPQPPSELNQSSAMVFPKVVLEESPPEEPAPASFFKDKKKKRLLLALVPILAVAFYFKYDSDKQKQQALALEQNKLKMQQQKLKVLYDEAVSNFDQDNFQFCIEQLEELHRIASAGFFENSQDILTSCQNGLVFQKQKKAKEEAEKQRQETELKIKELAERCQKEFDENKIKTLEDLNLCAADIFPLDPTNAVIAGLRNIIEEKETLKQLEEQKKAEYRKFIQGKRSLYNKAKKLKDQKKALKAVSAYNVFLKAARGVAGLKPLYKQAEQERDAVQQGYDDELNSLYESCESLIEAGKMKAAYYDCKKILNFKSYDHKAVSYIETSKRSLEVEIKPLYEKSLWHESFSRLDEAFKIWEQILEKDIKGGYYYKKAAFQLKKYK